MLHRMVDLNPDMNSDYPVNAYFAPNGSRFVKMDFYDFNSLVSELISDDCPV